MHHQFNIKKLYALPHTVFMCFVFIWEQTATCATYSINWLVFITEMKSVYSAVRTGALNKAACALCLKGWTTYPAPVDFTAFSLSKSLYSLSALFERTNSYVSVFTNLLVLTMYETKFPTHAEFIFLLFSLCNIFFDAQSIHLFLPAAMLSC